MERLVFVFVFAALVLLIAIDARVLTNFENGVDFESHNLKSIFKRSSGRRGDSGDSRDRDDSGSRSGRQPGPHRDNYDDDSTGDDDEPEDVSEHQEEHRNNDDDSPSVDEEEDCEEPVSGSRDRIYRTTRRATEPVQSEPTTAPTRRGDLHSEQNEERREPDGQREESRDDEPADEHHVESGEAERPDRPEDEECDEPETAPAPAVPPTGAPETAGPEEEIFTAQPLIPGFHESDESSDEDENEPDDDSEHPSTPAHRVPPRPQTTAGEIFTEQPLIPGFHESDEESDEVEDNEEDRYPTTPVPPVTTKPQTTARAEEIFTEQPLIPGFHESDEESDEAEFDGGNGEEEEERSTTIRAPDVTSKPATTQSVTTIRAPDVTSKPSTIGSAPTRQTEPTPEDGNSDEIGNDAEPTSLSTSSTPDLAGTHSTADYTKQSTQGQGQYDSQVEDTQLKTRHGHLFYGIIIAMAIFVLLMITGLIAYLAKRPKTNAHVSAYVAKEPIKTSPPPAYDCYTPATMNKVPLGEGFSSPVYENASTCAGPENVYQEIGLPTYSSLFMRSDTQSEPIYATPRRAKSLVSSVSKSA